MVIIVRVPSIKKTGFFAQHREERDKHHIYNNHPLSLQKMYEFDSSTEL